MSDQLTITMSPSDPLITSVQVLEDNVPVQIGYDDLDQIVGPTGPAGQDGAPGEQGPPGDGVGNLEELLTLGNDAGGIKIENLGSPSNPGDAVNKTHLDSVLSTAISAEATTRYNADLNESNARTNADAYIQAQVTSEVSLRANADASLLTNINNEASTRANADNNLSAAIDAEASARSAQDEVLVTAISDEVTARESADNSLQSQIDNIYLNIDGGTPGSIPVVGFVIDGGTI